MGLAAALLTWSAVVPIRSADPVILDVVVTDTRSRPVKDLQAADFELTDAGQTHAIDEAHLQSGAGRVIGIFLDEYHVQAGDSTVRARAALTHFVRDQLREGDVVALMKPLDSLNSITLTPDRDAIVQAIAAFEGRKGDYTPRTVFEQNFVSRDARTATVTRSHVVTSALQTLAARLGEPGPRRKALILVSEGFSPAMPRAIAQSANRHGVAIHPLDPQPDASPDESALLALAEQTGGYASINQPDIAPVLTQVLSDLDAYYLLTYQPAGQADGKFHPVQVRTKRAGLQVRTRAGYWSPAPPAPASTSSARAKTSLPFRPSHSSPYIRPWIGMARGSNGLTNVTVTWEEGTPPPRNQRVVSIAIKATGSDGGVIFQRQVSAADAGRATFDAPPGYIALEMALQSSAGSALDTDYRGLSVPNLNVTRPTFATPQVLRTRTARSFAETSINADALPVASRTFSRTERLLVRVPVYGPGDSTPAVTATLMNRRGAPMRVLSRVPADLAPGVIQFDLLLASLAPDEYRVEMVAANADGPGDEAREILVFRVTN